MRLLEEKIQEKVSQLANQLSAKFYSFTTVRPVPDDLVEGRLLVGHGFIGTADARIFLKPDQEILEIELSYLGSQSADPDADIFMDFPLPEELQDELHAFISEK